MAISRKGYHIKPHARYFCTCVEKKAHTSKRVSVIAPDNVISKAQFAPRARCGNRIVVVCHFPLQYSAQCTIMSNRLSC